MRNIHLFMSIGGGAGKTSIVSALLQTCNGVGIDASPGDTTLFAHKELDVELIESKDEFDGTSLFIDQLLSQIETLGKNSSKELFVDMAFNYMKPFLSHLSSNPRILLDIEEAVGGKIFYHFVISSCNYRSNISVLDEVIEVSESPAMKKRAIFWFNEYRVDYIVSKDDRLKAVEGFAGEALKAVIDLTVSPVLASTFHRFISGRLGTFKGAKERAGSVIWQNRIDEYQRLFIDICKQHSKDIFLSFAGGEEIAEEDDEKAEPEDNKRKEEDTSLVDTEGVDSEEESPQRDEQNQNADSGQTADDEATDDEDFSDLLPGDPEKPSKVDGAEDEISL